MSPTRREVYRFPDYPFVGRESKPKYGIVLGPAVRLENDRDDHVLIALTTSQTRHYRSSEYGCHAHERFPHFCLPEGSVPFFPVATHVDVEGVERAGYLECQYEAQLRGTLDDSVYQAILECVLATDIPGLYRKALTSLG